MLRALLPVRVAAASALGADAFRVRGVVAELGTNEPAVDGSEVAEVALTRDKSEGEARLALARPGAFD